MKIRSALILAVCSLSACATVQTPKDVDEFVARREMCDHFRGEIPDPEQVEEMRDTIRQINKYCPGTDATLAALKARYRDDPKVMAKLNVYDPHIEGKRQ